MLLWVSAVASLIVTSNCFLVVAFASDTFLWNNYPACAQAYLQDNAPSSCDHGSSTDLETSQTNACLCSDNSFLEQSAVDIFDNCGCPDLQASAETSYSNCAKSGATSVLSVAAFISAGDQGKGKCSGGNAVASSSTEGVIPSIATLARFSRMLTASQGLPPDCRRVQTRSLLVSA